jgi:hypothetical protein
MTDTKAMIKYEKLTNVSQKSSLGFPVLHVAHSSPHGLTWLSTQGKTYAMY